MRALRRSLVLLSAGAFLFALLAQAQDEPSLGDAARQARQQKQKDAQAKDDQAKDALAPVKDTPVKDTQAKDAQTQDAQTKDTQTKDAPAKDSQGNDAQAKAAPAKDAPPAMATKKVITNDDLPEHMGSTRTFASGSQTPDVTYPQPNTGSEDAMGESWEAQILQMKNSIAAMENNIKSVSDSIQYAAGNCVSGCVQWNEHQKQKQDQVEAMKAQLEQQRQRLEEMQETARKQGFGSSIYDP